MKPKRNKKYRQKPESVPMTIRFNSDCEMKLQLIPHQELAALIDGIGNETSWHTVTCRLNVGITMARNYFTDEAITVLALALDAIVDVRDRHTRVGKYGASSEEAKLIGAGLVLTDEMQKLCTRRQCRDAIEHVYRVAT
jgi:hypothetical protein